MNPSNRVIFIAFLVSLCLGISNLFQTGKLVFSFPLNEAILFIVSVVLYFYLYKIYRIQSTLLIVFSFYKLIQAPFLLTFFISEQSILDFLQNSILDFTFPLVQFLYFWIWYSFIKEEKNYKWLLSVCITGFLFMMIGIQINEYIILILLCSLLISFFLLLSDNKKKEFNVFFYFFLLDIWLLFSKILSIFILTL
ncbi:MAG: hypothetical protein HYU67_08980 [Flavobacteriia bacterium]|nr:hypothetical protein [Flavobacteriia bacterium]